MPLCYRFYIGFQEEVHSGGFSYDVCDSLEISANHFQMTYYLLIFLLILSGYFIYQDIKKKDNKSLFRPLVLAIAGYSRN
jgi:Ni,Fe-hydrogenase I cytochrome b subunit